LGKIVRGQSWRLREGVTAKGEFKRAEGFIPKGGKSRLERPFKWCEYSSRKEKSRGNRSYGGSTEGKGATRKSSRRKKNHH